MPTLASPRRSLQSGLIDRLKRLIVDQRLQPGDRLPTEQQLADRFHVSRLSLREAVRALRHIGLIDSSPRRGLTVARLDLDRLGESLDFHAAVAGYPDEQLVRARLALEVGILPLVAEAMARDPSLHGRLHALTEDPRILIDRERYAEADLDFHRALMAAAGVDALVMFSEVLRTFFARFRRQAVGDAHDRRKGIAVHRGVLAALRDGDLARAQALVLLSFHPYQGQKADTRQPSETMP